MKKNVRRRGFTLPEVLVTVTVVAVLAAVVVPAVTQYVNKGDTPATLQDITALRSAVTSYVADTRKYPTTLYDMTLSPASSTVDGYKGPYLTVQLDGATGAGTMTSGGLKLSIGPGITSAGGFLTTPFTFTDANATCADLYALDKALDGGDGTTSTAATTASNGVVVWTGGTCDTNPTGSLSGTTMSLQLVSIGA